MRKTLSSIIAGALLSSCSTTEIPAPAKVPIVQKAHTCIQPTENVQIQAMNLHNLVTRQTACKGASYTVRPPTAKGESPLYIATLQLPNGKLYVLVAETHSTRSGADSSLNEKAPFVEYDLTIASINRPYFIGYIDKRANGSLDEMEIHESTVIFRRTSENCVENCTENYTTDQQEYEALLQKLTDFYVLYKQKK